jgi:hypothetical protein
MKTLTNSFLLATFAILFFTADTYGQDKTTNGIDLQAIANKMSAKLVVKGESQSKIDVNIEATEVDQSVILVKEGGTLDITKALLKKMQGQVSDKSMSTACGLNACIVVIGKNSAITLENSGIKTEVLGGSGLFSVGEGSKAIIKGLTVRTNMDGSKGLVANLGGNINAAEVDILTQGAHSAALSVNLAPGNINLKGGTLKTCSGNSPAIYSAGNVVVEDALINAEVSECAVVESGSSVQVKNSILETNASNVIFLYGAGLNNKPDEIGRFSMIRGNVDIKSGDLFYATNTHYEIDLNKVTVLNAGKKSVLLKAGADQWGDKGKNGAQGILRISQQEVQGDVVCDKLSSCDFQIKDNSVWTGAINTKKTAQLAGVMLDETSTWKLSQDSYVHYILDAKTDLSNIQSNGKSIFYDAGNEKNAWLKGETRNLQGGGKILPMP